MTHLTQEYVQQCFNYQDGKLFWKVRPKAHFKSDLGYRNFNTFYAGDEAGCIAEYTSKKTKRCVIKLKGRLIYRYRLIYIYHYGELRSDEIIDHIDGNTLHDEIGNLRKATHEVNCYNTRKRKDNSSGVTGVGFNTQMGKWRARASQNGRDIILYYGDDFDDAVQARKTWESGHPHITPRHGS